MALGLLVLRVGVGIAFMAHGFPKLFMGGAAGLAKGMGAAGIPGGITGAYMAGTAEFFGGIALLLGLLTRPAAFVMAFTMAVALSYHFSKGDNYQTYSHALESGILFLSLLIAGPGKYSFDRLIWRARGDKEGSRRMPHKAGTPRASEDYDHREAA